MRNQTATTPAAYLAALPADRRRAISDVRKVVRKHLPKGYAECVSFGMLSYAIPLTQFRDTGNGQPLMYVALAAQKKYCSLYLMSVYGSTTHEAELRDAFRAAGKKLDMGKSCIHFRTADDLPLDAIGRIIGSIPAERWIETFESSRKKRSHD